MLTRNASRDRMVVPPFPLPKGRSLAVLFLPRQAFFDAGGRWLYNAESDGQIKEAEMVNAFKNLWKSRKFLLLMLDTIISLTLYFIGKYAGPGVSEDVNMVIGLIQPVFVAIIIGIAVEDAAMKRNGGSH